jgi:TolB-like protein/Flp pilus assembly protein TadD
VTDPGKAVFLSYASEDAEAALRLCNALRAAAIEVWFDQSELRGGDVWDQKIRREIHDCALFIPVISANTASRHEGYFRLEWDLADQRTHMLARNRAFIVPVCLDATPDADADVPESFQRVQWTRLPGGQTPGEFVRRIEQLLSGEARPTTKAAQGPAGVASGRPPRWAWLAVAVVIAAAAAYLLVEKPWGPKPPPPAVLSPPAHSIAVLPFVNLSGDPSQEYFSDGLTEELLNSLSEINELQVAARTSAFSFKGTNADIGTIARKLNVGAVLEGSVRRSANTIRVTAQLINAVTGFHLWSKTYDRDLGDMLKLQTEIATAVAAALKVTLLGDVAAKVELGGTRNPAAFDAYLRGVKTGRTALGDEDTQAAIAAYTEAIQLDSHFATAFAARSLELSNYADFNAQGPAVRLSFDKALADARTAVSLAPELADGHYVLAVALQLGLLDFAGANDEYERALALAPGSARILGAYSRYAAEVGHTSAAIAAARRAVILDPLNFHVHRTAGIAFLLVRHYADAVTAYRTAISLQPDYVRNYALLGVAQYNLGDFEGARSSCEVARADESGQQCLAVVYRKLGRDADAEAMLQKLKSARGDDGAYDFACIYAQWGEIPQAIRWLETAIRLRNPGLVELKAEPDLDPLRKEPRYQAIERELKFPT